MTQSHLIELAKGGDPNAIATLMNRSLQPKGILARVSREGNRLRIQLEAEQVPNREALMTFVQNGLSNLHIDNVSTVEVVGQQSGQGETAWVQEWQLDPSDAETGMEFVSRSTPNVIALGAPPPAPPPLRPIPPPAPPHRPGMLDVDDGGDDLTDLGLEGLGFDEETTEPTDLDLAGLGFDEELANPIDLGLEGIDFDEDPTESTDLGLEELSFDEEPTGSTDLGLEGIDFDAELANPIDLGLEGIDFDEDPATSTDLGLEGLGFDEEPTESTDLGLKGIDFDEEPVEAIAPDVVPSFDGEPAEPIDLGLEGLNFEDEPIDLKLEELNFSEAELFSIREGLSDLSYSPLDLDPRDEPLNGVSRAEAIAPDSDELPPELLAAEAARQVQQEIPADLLMDEDFQDLLSVQETPEVAENVGAARFASVNDLALEGELYPPDDNPTGDDAVEGVTWNESLDGDDLVDADDSLDSGDLSDQTTADLPSIPMAITPTPDMDAGEELQITQLDEDGNDIITEIESEEPPLQREQEIPVAGMPLLEEERLEEGTVEEWEASPQGQMIGSPIAIQPVEPGGELVDDAKRESRNKVWTSIVFLFVGGWVLTLIGLSLWTELQNPEPTPSPTPQAEKLRSA